MFFQLNKILLSIFFVFVSSVVFSDNNIVLYGKARTDEAGNIQTSDSESYFIKSKSGNELRMKRLTSVKASKNLDFFIIKEGTIGVKNASESVVINTENIYVNILPNSVVVVKRIDNFDRVCVIKGRAEVSHKKYNSNIEVLSELEIAASDKYLSRIYKRSDDMRFMWYWYSPEKEPSLIK